MVPSTHPSRPPLTPAWKSAAGDANLPFPIRIRPRAKFHQPSSLESRRRRQTRGRRGYRGCGGSARARGRVRSGPGGCRFHRASQTEPKRPSPEPKCPNPDSSKRSSPRRRRRRRRSLGRRRYVPAAGDDGASRRAVMTRSGRRRRRGVRDPRACLESVWNLSGICLESDRGRRGRRPQTPERPRRERHPPGPWAASSIPGRHPRRHPPRRPHPRHRHRHRRC